MGIGSTKKPLVTMARVNQVIAVLILALAMTACKANEIQHSECNRLLALSRTWGDSLLVMSVNVPGGESMNCADVLDGKRH